jgi:DNA-binding MarR family transcriptional regulator
VRKQTMAQAVEELEQLGYVERRADPNDRRARLVFLTARGQKVKPIAVAAGRRVEARWSKLMGAQNMESLRRSLEEVLAQLDQVSPRA